MSNYILDIQFSDELSHGLFGKARSSHKYIDRVWKNGKWRYIYERAKTQRELKRNQPLIGATYRGGKIGKDIGSEEAWNAKVSDHFKKEKEKDRINRDNRIKQEVQEEQRKATEAWVNSRKNRSLEDVLKEADKPDSYFFNWLSGYLVSSPSFALQERKILDHEGQSLKSPLRNALDKAIAKSEGTNVKPKTNKNKRVEK